MTHCRGGRCESVFVRSNRKMDVGDKVFGLSLLSDKIREFCFVRR